MKKVFLAILLLCLAAKNSLACPLISLQGFDTGLVRSADLVVQGRLTASSMTTITTDTHPRNELHLWRFDMQVKKVLSDKTNLALKEVSEFTFYSFSSLKQFESMPLNSTYIAVLRRYPWPRADLMAFDGELTWTSENSFHTVLSKGCNRIPYIFPQISEEGRATRLLFDQQVSPEAKSKLLDKFNGYYRQQPE